MGLHPIPIPGTRFVDVECVPYGDTILVYFEDEVSYTYTQTPPSPPAFSPQLPYGTFYKGDSLGILTAQSVTSDTVINYTVGGRPGRLTIKVKPSCP